MVCFLKKNIWFLPCSPFIHIFLSFFSHPLFLSLSISTAKLSGGVAVIKVGGASEVEVGEKKDRITDALNATKAAVEEGILPGGGTALLYASQALGNLKTENFDQSVGVKIVRNAIRVPCQSICDNAGLEGAVVVGKLLDHAKGNAHSSYGRCFLFMYIFFVP